jgi:ATP phosphoribosyltransferase
MRPVILALPKGRILDEAAAVFARAGYDLSPVLGDSRRLVHECGVLRVLVLRSSDIATYVAHGAADVGVAGSDVLDEDARDLTPRSTSARSRTCGSPPSTPGRRGRTSTAGGSPPRSSSCRARSSSGR